MKEGVRQGVGEVIGILVAAVVLVIKAGARSAAVEPAPGRAPRTSAPAASRAAAMPSTCARLSRDQVDDGTCAWQLDQVVAGVLEVNLIGFALTARAILPLMLEQGGGAIVSTPSIAAHVGHHQRAAHQTNKAGINALTRHITSRWDKQGMRGNCVSPGIVLTESAEKMDLNSGNLATAKRRMPSTRFGRPTDLAGIIAFLLSGDAEWINRQI